jgi:hypothetical protein
METLKKLAQDIAAKRAELKATKTRELRAKLKAAAGGAGKDALRCGSSVVVRLVQQKTVLSLTKGRILQALRLMKEATAVEFLAKLSSVRSGQTTDVLRITKSTRGSWRDADAETRAIVEQLQEAAAKRAHLRRQIKQLVGDYVPHERAVCTAMASDGTTTFLVDGVTLQRKTRRIRSRVPIRDAGPKLQHIFNDPGTSDLETLAEIIFEALNPVHVQDHLVLKTSK